MRNLIPRFGAPLLGVVLLFIAGRLFGAEVARGATAVRAPDSPDATAARSPAAQITGAALVQGGAFFYTRELADRIGARPAGSAGAERAVKWALAEMTRAGLTNVHREAVRVPHWIRGEEAAELVAPAAQPLKVVALGNSVGTPPAGIEAEVVEVASFDELGKPGENLAPGAAERFGGRIVLFNQPMRRTIDFAGYGEAVPQRTRGAILAARAGAVAVLVRSVGTNHDRLPHTGAMRIDPSVPRIPAAAIASEDAELLHRFLNAGEKVRVHLRLGARDGGEVDSANVIGELRGRELPDEVVVIGAHLDSWDLGTGALDDAAGCGIVLDTARTLLQLGLRPRRTVRVVLFMNEELGLSGARAYAEAHKAELGRHAAALEADSGAGLPRGYLIAGGEPSRAILSKWVAPLAHLLPIKIRSTDEVGADLVPIQMAGVPVVSVEQDVSDYFDWHHSAGDLVDKVNPHDLALTAAAFASLTYYAAESPTRLPPSPPPPLH